MTLTSLNGDSQKGDYMGREACAHAMNVNPTGILASWDNAGNISAASVQKKRVIVGSTAHIFAVSLVMEFRVSK